MEAEGWIGMTRRRTAETIPDHHLHNHKDEENAPIHIHVPHHARLQDVVVQQLGVRHVDEDEVPVTVHTVVIVEAEVLREVVLLVEHATLGEDNSGL